MIALQFLGRAQAAHNACFVTLLRHVVLWMRTSKSASEPAPGPTPNSFRMPQAVQSVSTRMRWVGLAAPPARESCSRPRQGGLAARPSWTKRSGWVA